MTDFVIGPAESASSVIGIIPSCGTSLSVGFMVNRADRSLGIMSEPIVSVPMEIGAKPAATATAEPLEDPPGFYQLSDIALSNCDIANTL